VAIPAHLGRHFVAARVRVLVHDMEWAGNELLRYLLREHRKGGGQS
jgi:biopolymer transport protein ExbB